MLPDDSLHAARCRACGNISFPARCLCPDCRASDFDPLPLVGLEGEVVSWTTMHALPPGMASHPTHLAVVELENGVRALGHLQGDRPRVGARVQTTRGAVRMLDGAPVEGLIFVETG